MSARFHCLAVGSLVISGGGKYEITHFLSSDSVLAKNLETLSSERLKIESLKVFIEKDNDGEKEKLAPKDPEDYSEEDWAIAQQRYKAIQPLLDEPHPTRRDAEKAASRAEVGVATIYRWRDTYVKAGHVSALVPDKRGRKKGTKLLGMDREELLATTINEHYLNTDRNSIQDTIELVELSFKAARIKPPHPNTTRKRIQTLSPGVVLRARGYSDQARNKYQPVRGKFPGAGTPLAVVQIDHSEGDVILVEETTRLPIGRPWITLAIDVCSRVVTGLYVSFEHPSSLSAGMCVANSILPKDEYLAELEVPGAWPVWGKMGILHADNAKEFRGEVLHAACREYSIDPQFRPVKVPHYGGHIERLMGTAAREALKLPGKTFSSPAERKGYNSCAKSALTLREFEQQLVDFIVNIYHQRVHSELGMPPIRKWELGIMGDGDLLGIGLPPLAADPFRLRLNFMPFVERTVQTYGLEIDKVFYYSEVLNPFINQADQKDNKRKRKFIIRRDPRDISKVFFYDPDSREYYSIPYRDIQHPPMSLWELKEVRRILKEEGAKHVDEEAIFNALVRMRQRVEEAKHKSKKARRSLSRNPKQRKLGGLPGVVAEKKPVPSPTTTIGSLVEEDIFADPTCFDDLRGPR